MPADWVLLRQISTLLADPAVSRAHWGIKVTAMDGSPIYSMNEGQLFQPASNAKLFTTAAAMALLGAGATFETKAVARGSFDGAEKLTGDLVLIGGGDANLSGREIPYVAPALRPKPSPPAPPALRYLEEMADQIGVDSLAYISIDGLYRALGKPDRDQARPHYCDACFTGDYPIARPDRGDNSDRQLSLLVE